MTLSTYKNFREKHEYKLVFSQNLEEDFEEIFLNIKNYSQAEYEATYVLSLIKNAILELKILLFQTVSLIQYALQI